MCWAAGLGAKEKGEEDSPWNPRRWRLHLAAAYGGSARRRPLQLRLRQIWSLAAPSLGESASPSPARYTPPLPPPLLPPPLCAESWLIATGSGCGFGCGGRERETWEMRGEAARSAPDLAAG